jgi:serine/threonine protein kinase
MAISSFNEAAADLQTHVYSYGVTTPPEAMIITELLYGSLHDLIYSNDVLSPSLLLRICRDVAAGTAYLHTRSPPIIHRDLSSVNVLVTGSRSQLDKDVGDFNR